MLTVLAAAAGAGGSPDPLGFDFWTWFFQALNVLIILLALYYLLWRPLRGIIEERERTIADSLDGAAQAREESEKLLAQYTEQIQQARAEAERIVEEARRAAEEAREKLLAEAEAQAERTLEGARREITRERERALAAVRDEVAHLAILAAGKVLGRSLDDEGHRRLTREFVERMDGEAQ